MPSTSLRLELLNWLAQAETAKLEAEKSALCAENSRYALLSTSMVLLPHHAAAGKNTACIMAAACRLRRELDEASTSYRNLAVGVAAELDKRAWLHSLATRIKGVLQATQPDSAPVRKALPSLQGSSNHDKTAHNEQVWQAPCYWSCQATACCKRGRSNSVFYRVAVAVYPRVSPFDTLK